MKFILKPLLMVATIVFGSLAGAAAPAWALVEINVNKGNVEPLPIAITDFQSNDALGAQITQIVTADLKRSGLFAPVDKSAFIDERIFIRGDKSTDYGTAMKVMARISAAGYKNIGLVSLQEQDQ